MLVVRATMTTVTAATAAAAATVVARKSRNCHGVITQQYQLFERGLFEPPQFYSHSFTGSVSPYMPCGWRPVSECTPLLLSFPIFFKHPPLLAPRVTPGSAAH